MRTTRKRRDRRGYISYVMVLTTGALLTLLMMYGYRQALFSQSVQSSLQLRADYSEKEDAVLRSLVSIVPNRAMLAMKNSSANAGQARDSLRWQNIFADAMTQANASSSVSAALKASIGKTASISANTGDGTMGTTNLMFTNIHGADNTVYVTPGINRAATPGYPEALVTADSAVSTNDLVYPIIARSKNYTGLGKTDYKTIKYPSINFGYAKPGQNFLAKRNWWAFSMDLAGHDSALTGAQLNRRQFVLSIYEIPSQLAISASSFVSLGTYANGQKWSGISVAGNVFADKAEVGGGIPLDGLASRRGVKLNSGTTVGGESFSGNPFAPGVREQYEVTSGEFFPVSMPSESGRASFVPINRGADFFDRFADGNAAEANTLSTTTWNEYSSGALQCAMRLDVSKVASSSNLAPTEFKFQYYKGGNRTTLTLPPIQGNSTTLPEGYTQVAVEGGKATFSEPTDLAYGIAGGFYFKTLSGEITFDNATFGDPKVGTLKNGYKRARAPFTTTSGPGGKICIEIYPERFPKFLAALGGDPVTGTISPTLPYLNNSIVVNSDYKTMTTVRKPSFPSTMADYGLIMNECADLSAFTKGFSLVTNYRLYIGSDFNTSNIVPPVGYTGTLPYYPPCSLFAPEKRYGWEMNPYSVGLMGQVGSLASESASTPSRPLDSVGMDETPLNAGNTRINLRPLVDPADLPPVTMMNWLVVIEERRREFW